MGYNSAVFSTKCCSSEDIYALDPPFFDAAADCQRCSAAKGLECPVAVKVAETKRIKYRHQGNEIKPAPHRAVRIWPTAKFSIRVSCKSSLAAQ